MKPTSKRQVCTFSFHLYHHPHHHHPHHHPSTSSSSSVKWWKRRRRFRSSCLLQSLEKLTPHLPLFVITILLWAFFYNLYTMGKATNWQKERWSILICWGGRVLGAVDEKHPLGFLRYRHDEGGVKIWNGCKTYLDNIVLPFPHIAKSQGGVFHPYIYSTGKL